MASALVLMGCSADDEPEVEPAPSSSSTADDTDRSNLLWTLANAARQAGDLDAALHAAREKQALDQKNGADREASHNGLTPCG